MKEEFQPTQVYTDNPVNHEGELFSYQFIVGKDINGEIGVMESVYISNEYREDPEIQNVVDDYIKDAGITPAIKRAFVTFGIKSDLLKSNAHPVLEGLRNVSGAFKVAMDHILEGKE